MNLLFLWYVHCNNPSVPWWDYTDGDLDWTVEQFADTAAGTGNTAVGAEGVRSTTSNPDYDEHGCDSRKGAD